MEEGLITYWRKQNLAERRALAARLRAAREDAGLKQRDVAYRLGIPQSIISELETGQRRLDVAELWSLAQLYGKRASWFLDHDATCKTPATTRVLLVYDGDFSPGETLSAAGYTIVPHPYDGNVVAQQFEGIDMVLVAVRDVDRGHQIVCQLPEKRVPLILAVPQADGLPLEGCDAIVAWHSLPDSLDLAVRMFVSSSVALERSQE